MTTPQEFISRVVAWPGSNEPGYVNIHTFRRDKKKDPDNPKEKAPCFGSPFRDPNDLYQYVQSCVGAPGKHEAIYFCTSTQAEKKVITTKDGRKFDTAVRDRNKAVWFKSIWLDVDVGKKDGYNNETEAGQAIRDFRHATSLPGPSAIVRTGGGLHVYWTSKTRLTKAEWQGYAEGLKEEAKKFGLKADLQCTADAARILRVPGTFNYKYGKPRKCYVLHMEPDDYDFPAVLGHIRKTVTAPITGATQKPTIDTSGWGPPPAALVFTDHLSDGIGVARYNGLLDPKKMFEQCQHFAATKANGGVHDPEPLWMLNLLATTFIEDGDTWAHDLSKGYPNYDREETNKKLDERKAYKSAKNLGWPSCTNFEAAGAKCLGCPLRGHIKTPLHLCIPVTPPTPAAKLQLQELPYPYEWNDEGIICKKIIATKGDEDEEYVVPLFYSKLRNFQTTTIDKRPCLVMEVNQDMDNWTKGYIFETDLAGEQKLYTALRREGIKPFPPNKRHIEDCMTSFWNKLDKEDYRSHTVPFGWLYKSDGGEIPIGFAYGGVAYYADGTEGEAGSADPTLASILMPKGDTTSADWWRLLKLVTDQHHPALEALIAISFGSPLIFGAGQYNALVCGWSPEAGSHKSTSIHIGAAVWGEPKRTKEKPNATQKGIMRKAGEMRNLPIYWDEISDERKLSYVRQMIGDMTEGGIGSRLRQDRTIFTYDSWQTMLTVCANMSLTNNIMTHNSSTDAQLQRTFEFQVEKRGDTMRPHEVALLVNSLDYNYGYIGKEFAKVLGSDPAGHKEYVKKICERFGEEVNAPSEARFRSAVAACIYAGAELANQRLNTTFNLEELWVFLKAEWLRQTELIDRAEVVAGRKNNAINTMTQFFKSNVRNTLWLDKLPIVGRGRPWVIQLQHPHSANEPVHVRCGASNRIIEVSKHHLLDWFAENKAYNASATLEALKVHFGAEEFPRIDLSYGAGVPGGRETILSIPVPPKSPFTHLLFMHTSPEKLPKDVRLDDDPFSNTVLVSSSSESSPSPQPQGMDEVLGVEMGMDRSITVPVTASENIQQSSGPTEDQATTSDSPEQLVSS